MVHVVLPEKQPSVVWSSRWVATYISVGRLVDRPVSWLVGRYDGSAESVGTLTMVV
jgi:hypothetical protein